MQKFSINIEALETKLSKKAYRLSDVKDRLEKVSFDLVRFRDGDEMNKLWQVQSADDGEFIVSLYEDAPEIKEASWEVIFSKTANALNFYYKGDPIVKIAAQKLGIPQDEVQKAERYLPSKLAENKDLVKSLLAELPESTKKTVLTKYPELF